MNMYTSWGCDHVAFSAISMAYSSTLNIMFCMLGSHFCYAKVVSWAIDF